MLPDLARLCLRHEAPVGADDADVDLRTNEVLSGFEPSPSPKRPRRVASSTPPTVPKVIDEEDDPDVDANYDHLMKKAETHEGTKRLLSKLDREWPIDYVHNLLHHQTRSVFDEVLTYDEPPNRHLFSSLGMATPIRHVRLDKHSILTVPGPNPIQINAFAALLALRLEFANKPSSTTRRDGCGQSNCYVGGVNLNGYEEWRVALRAVMLSVDHARGVWKGGEALPRTVAIRAPKAMKYKFKYYDTSSTNDARDELGLTLRAAQMGITPPVYATFPVKVISENTRTLCKRDYAYVCEDGWADLWSVLHTLERVHTNANDLKLAKYYIAKSTSMLLHKVANVAEYLMLDIKTLNMVTRRVGDTLKYEVQMIDFGALLTTNPNFDSDAQNTTPQCIFFLNGVLFLNFIVGYHANRISMFYDLATEVVQTWKDLRPNPLSLCAWLAADAARIKEADIPHFDQSLMRLKGHALNQRLRFNFYLTLSKYGDKERLLPEADNFALSGKPFLDCYMQLLEKRYAESRA